VAVRSIEPVDDDTNGQEPRHGHHRYFSRILHCVFRYLPVQNIQGYNNGEET
jgi:hypothetical protein